MAIKLVERKFDDFDGQELPQDTKPWKLKYQGREYDLYLSPENREKVENFMGRLIGSATSKKTDPLPTFTPAGDLPTTDRYAPVKRASTTKRTSAKRGGKRDLTAVRAWLKENGHDVPERGVLKKELIDAYEQGTGTTVAAKKPAKKAAKKATSKSSPAAKKTASSSTTPKKYTPSGGEVSESAASATESAAASTAATEGVSAAS